MVTLRTNTKQIQRHYDFVSPYYYKFWSEHIHHGYWITGKESKDVATVQLMELLVSKIAKQKVRSILDVGCGVGGSSRWLSSKYGAKVKGVTISTKQVEIAESLTNSKLISFEQMDANNLTLSETFDVIWAVEMISHLNKRESFFKKCHSLLNQDGYMALADWFVCKPATPRQKKIIKNINYRMMVDMQAPLEYVKSMEDAGFQVVYFEDISEQVKKTWDLCLDIIKKKEFWQLAFSNGAEFVEFLKAFKDMRAGFESGAFRYCAIVARKMK